MHIVVQRIASFPLAIPLKPRASRGTANQGVAYPVVVAIALSNGTIGYGESAPEASLTHEDAVSVVSDVREVFMPFLLDFRPRSFPDALESIEALPWRDATNRLIPAARAAVELALLDAALQTFDRTCDDVVGWMGIAGFGSPGSAGRIRFGGTLGAQNLDQTLRELRLMYWGGLRDFRLDIGSETDMGCVRRVSQYLAQPLAKGRASLRIDANGAWSKDEAIEWLSDADDIPFTLLEQPLARGDEKDLPVLGDLFDVPVMHDESLITMEDAQQLIDLGIADAFNIRISKCGGLLPSLRLAALARRSSVRIQLGCAVGETSILSAVGLRFLQVCPGVGWAEGCAGMVSSSRDVTSRALRRGFGGRLPRLRGKGFGVCVDPLRLEALCVSVPSVLNL